jgi:hypothetical protein
MSLVSVKEHGYEVPAIERRRLTDTPHSKMICRYAFPDELRA